jgi:hypothetical protein
MLSRVGVYKVRLCINGCWKSITIDDYFPCDVNGGPIYSRNHDSELWVLLLEKAFAKSFGSYHSLRFGYCYEAMIDLTGAPFRNIRFPDSSVKAQIESGVLWGYVLDSDRAGYLISAVTYGEDLWSEAERPSAAEIKRLGGPRGLVAGHAYTILTAVETRAGHKLIKFRNPWGRGEWQGRWSDNSDLWTDELRTEVGAETIEDDGTFWMCFDDVVQYFYSMTVCMTLHRSGEFWHEKRVKSCFIFNDDDQSSENFDNRFIPPMYVLSLLQQSKVFVSVFQEDIRAARAAPYIDIGVTVLKVTADYSFELVASGMGVERQVQTEMTLPPGNYVVVPISTGCKYRHFKTEVGNIFFESSAEQLKAQEFNEVRMLNEHGTALSMIARDAFTEVFHRLDEDMDGVNTVYLLLHVLRTNYLIFWI